MKNINFLSSWVKRFLLEYLISVRNLSQNTQKSYRDTFRLFLPFTAKRLKKSVDQLVLEDLSPEEIKIFLSNLESMRSCSVATRNQRLATLHSFTQFVGLNSPEHVELCRRFKCEVQFDD
jgi:integrase/recombinase XerD